ncbi:hypothetical protein [Nocardioides alcanivorans]|uniref:hypothetical protein n=1 Tax=Nocardioides alcanivorans TaxID=2897352 RepID=UPI001F2A7493|nr:hypothetical protein [Nocardioides alcanivorans]
MIEGFQRLFDTAIPDTVPGESLLTYALCARASSTLHFHRGLKMARRLDTTAIDVRIDYGPELTIVAATDLHRGHPRRRQ